MADLTTQLSKFLADVYGGTLGVAVPFTTVSASGAMVSPFAVSSASSVLAVNSNVIAPTGSVHHVGAGLIKTITVPAAVTGPWVVTLIPDAAFTYDATGNIVVPAGGGTAVVNRAMSMTWDGAKFTPDY